MKKYSRVFVYLKDYKLAITSYIICTLLSIVFSIISLGMLFPFLQVLFKVNDAATTVSTAKAVGFSPFEWVKQKVAALVAAGDNLYALSIICMLIIGSIVLKNIFLYLASRSLMPAKNKVITRFRIDIFNKVLSLPIGYFTEQRKGDLMSRMTNDINQVEGSVIGALEGWVKDPLQIIITLAVLLSISVQLTIVILFFIPVMGFFIGRLGRSLKKPSGEVAQKSGESISILDETLGGLRVIKAFNVEAKTRKKFFDNSMNLMRITNKIGYRQSFASPMSEMLGVMMFTAILWYGGSKVLSHEPGLPLNGALFLAYMALFYNIIDPAKSISGAFSNLQRGTAAIARIEEVLNAPVTVDDNPNGKQITSFNDSIEFKNVSFYYDDVAILQNISFKVEKGKTIALVGSSGAGKSTLADLIPRFHDATHGDILVDGVSIKDYSLFSLRSLMSIVTQEPILFNDTIANNIALGMDNATEADIINAAKIANAHSFIEKKELGYATNIGDRGMKLSGGERQRLTIARAVLKNPPILILDEATSSLDTESERLVQDAINNLMENRTSVVIAHRLSTIRHANEIIVLRKGEIVERGTHAGLIEQNGFYKKLVEMQEVK
ncbi:ABC transporter ATP-binding protein [Ferruginibacter yonginensis]|uniref:ABC transporter ATP-binding protein n=1 Tax=Ferruginibacter yonginensis TaxID=1310416 RepID=A0ABV8QUU1_9BACT